MPFPFFFYHSWKYIVSSALVKLVRTKMIALNDFQSWGTKSKYWTFPILTTISIHFFPLYCRLTVAVFGIIMVHTFIFRNLNSDKSYLVTTVCSHKNIYNVLIKYSCFKLRCSVFSTVLQKYNLFTSLTATYSSRVLGVSSLHH